MATKALTKAPTKKSLRKAADLLQAAHDRIEQVGFDIHHYGPSHQAKTPSCYIGNIRAVAGVDPSDVEYGMWDSDAGKGDGPELILALEAMDKVARRRLNPGRRETATKYNVTTGRFVEELGFQIEQRAWEKFPDPDQGDGESWDDYYERYSKVGRDRQAYQQQYALKLLRKALTNVYG